jgi:dTDP-4-amino-4,6-dideoxygalactose transaminase
MKYYRDKYNHKDEQFPVATSWGAGVLCLPLFPGLTSDQQEYVIKTFKEKILPKFSNGASR